jgi:CO dehydrogenase/acetyl-CoA synthase beta subunit
MSVRGKSQHQPPIVSAGETEGTFLMELFREQFDFIDNWLAERADRNQLTTIAAPGPVTWPTAGQRNLVIGRDIAVELGHPDDASVAFIAWGASSGERRGGRIYRVGPDLPASQGQRRPFAKVVMIRGSGFDADNTYTRYRQLEAVRYAIDLKGYMMRAVSQVNREWSRVSHAALENGFSFAVLGGALIAAFTALDWVDRADVLFVTSSRADVMALQPLAERVRQVTGAMNKMSEAMNFDCESCSYADVCGDVAGLRAMRKVMEQRDA